MGLNGSRVIQIKNVDEHLEQCESLGAKSKDYFRKVAPSTERWTVFVTKGWSLTQETAQIKKLLIQFLPDLLLVPEFVLLEDISPSSVDELLDIIKGICQMALDGGVSLGIGRARIAYRDRWGVVGEKDQGWTYQQVYEEGITEGIYFSPQQMIGYSQSRPTPKYNSFKADVFALGVMLVEIIFGEQLDYIYDFQNFQIKLNPLLQKLQGIKRQFGQDVANMFICMLEIQEQDRYDFQDLLEAVGQIIAMKQQKVAGVHMLNSNSSQRHLQHSRGNRTPGRAVAPPNPYNKTPKNDNKSKYRNDVSPFRGRFGGSVKNNSQANDRMKRTPERGNQSRSPMRRNLQINTRGDRQTFGTRGLPTPKQLDFPSHQGISQMCRR